MLSDDAVEEGCEVSTLVVGACEHGDRVSVRSVLSRCDSECTVCRSKQCALCSVELIDCETRSTRTVPIAVELVACELACDDKRCREESLHAVRVHAHALCRTVHVHECSDEHGQWCHCVCRNVRNDCLW